MRSLLKEKNSHSLNENFPITWSFLPSAFPSECKKNFLEKFTNVPIQKNFPESFTTRFELCYILPLELVLWVAVFIFRKSVLSFQSLIVLVGRDEKLKKLKKKISTIRMRFGNMRALRNLEELSVFLSL